LRLGEVLFICILVSIYRTCVFVSPFLSNFETLLVWAATTDHCDAGHLAKYKNGFASSLIRIDRDINLKKKKKLAFTHLGRFKVVCFDFYIFTPFICITHSWSIGLWCMWLCKCVFLWQQRIKIIWKGLFALCVITILWSHLINYIW
jgi:hypothetical protein